MTCLGADPVGGFDLTCLGADLVWGGPPGVGLLGLGLTVWPHIRWDGGPAREGWGRTRTLTMELPSIFAWTVIGVTSKIRLHTKKTKEIPAGRRPAQSRPRPPSPLPPPPNDPTLPPTAPRASLCRSNIAIGANYVTQWPWTPMGSSAARPPAHPPAPPPPRRRRR